MGHSVNPFFHQVSFSGVDLFWFLVTGPVLVPIRVTLVVCLTLFCWLVARLGLAGVSTDRLDSEPLTGWGAAWQRIFWVTSGHGILWALGFRCS